MQYHKELTREHSIKIGPKLYIKKEEGLRLGGFSISAHSCNVIQIIATELYDVRSGSLVTKRDFTIAVFSLDAEKRLCSEIANRRDVFRAPLEEMIIQFLKPLQQFFSSIQNDIFNSLCIKKGFEKATENVKELVRGMSVDELAKLQEITEMDAEEILNLSMGKFFAAMAKACSANPKLFEGLS